MVIGGVRPHAYGHAMDASPGAWQGVPPGARAPGPSAAQLSLDDLGTPLSEVTFVVVDLETTGGRPADAQITEIGAVAVRGGEVIGEFATLVNPGVPVPPFIAALTGITDPMLAGAPGVATATAAFWEFARGAVLVAHNAPYDIGFLKGAAALAGQDWPAPRIIDTARLARRVLTRDEVRDCKLGTLATFFRAETTPIHRALDDARATVAVLHGLLDRLGSAGVITLEDLLAYGGRTSEGQRRKRTLAQGIPAAPGVYVFRDRQGAPLYVGTSRNLKARVAQYFTASEQRRRMREMVDLAAEVTPIVCATPLEAQVRELRLIGEHRPHFNRRSRAPERLSWIALGPTGESPPRLTIVGVRGARHRALLGPFTGRRAAEIALAALRPLLDAGDITGIEQAMSGDTRAVVAAVGERMSRHASEGRFEAAQAWRDRLEALLRAAERGARLALLAGTAEIVGARPAPAGWEIHVVRHGRLAGAGIAPHGRDPRPMLDAIVSAAEVVAPAADVVAPGPPTLPAARVGEADLLWDWLVGGDVRLVRSSAALSMPCHLGGAALAAVRRARGAGDALRYSADHRPLRPTG